VFSLNFSLLNCTIGMSVVSRIFGSAKKGESVQSPSEAVQRLRDVEEMLQKKSDFLEQKIEHEVSVAKKNSSRNKQGFCMDLVIFQQTL